MFKNQILIINQRENKRKNIIKSKSNRTSDRESKININSETNINNNSIRYSKRNLPGCFWGTFIVVQGSMMGFKFNQGVDCMLGLPSNKISSFQEKC